MTKHMIGLLAVLIMVAPLLGGCVLLAAGVAGAVVANDLRPGFHRCFQVGGGSSVVCRDRYYYEHHRYR
jgi:hypothetical protein